MHHNNNIIKEMFATTTSLFLLLAMSSLEVLVKAFVDGGEDLSRLRCCDSLTPGTLQDTCCLPPPSICKQVTVHYDVPCPYIDCGRPTPSILHKTKLQYACPQTCITSTPLTNTLGYSQNHNGAHFYYNDSCQTNDFMLCSDTPNCWVKCATCAYGFHMDSDCTLGKDTQCSACAVQPNAYLPANVDCTVAENWTPCDPCTNPNLYGPPHIHGCPPFLDNMGYSSATLGTCLPCTSCEGDTYFTPSGELEGLKCVTDRSTQCKAPPPLSFQFGSRRVHGLHNSDQNHNTGDILPFRKPCDAPFPPPNFIEKGPTNSWDDDCDYLKVAKCKTGHYTRNAGKECLPCPNDDHGESPGNDRCVCAAGTALAQDIFAALGGIKGTVPLLEQKCYDCANDVLMPQGAGLSYEMVICPKNGPVQRCGLLERVVNNACVRCEPGSIPTMNKGKCIKCLRGTYFDGILQDCVSCQGDNFWCPDEGMTIPKKKNFGCAAGQMLDINTNPLTDNACVPCPSTCSDNNLLVYADNRTHDNACSLTAADGDSVHFFACYPSDGSNTLPAFTGSGHRLRFEPHYSSGGGNNKVIVDSCSDDWLPSNAQWVNPGTQYPLGCVFACQYGWDPTLAQKLQAQIQLAVTSMRQDLYDFWHTIMNQQPIQSKTKYIGAKEKVLWPKKDNGVSYIPNQWAQTYTVSAKVSNLSATYSQQNTFLYLDEALPPPTGLCLAPKTPLTTPCPLGFFIPSQQPTRTQCALLARTLGLNEIQFSDDDTLYYAIIDTTTNQGSILCHVPTQELWLHHWSSYDQCLACLDQNPPAASSEVEVTWRSVASWTQNFYAFKTLGSCEGMTCTGATVAFGNACVPCNAPASVWRSICSPSVFNELACKASGKPLSTQDVCIPCDGLNAKAGWLTNTQAIAQWTAARPPQWASFTCMYICDLGYTSNMDVKAYATDPCVPCMNVIQDFKDRGQCNRGEGAWYFDETTAMHTCTYQSQFLPYTPTCQACVPRPMNGLLLLNPNPIILASGLMACLAICDPQLYFTLHLNGSKVFSPIEQGQILRCEPCGEEHLASCANMTVCQAGYFW